jgi:hypothetical protein
VSGALWLLGFLVGAFTLLGCLVAAELGQAALLRLLRRT